MQTWTVASFSTLQGIHTNANTHKRSVLLWMPRDAISTCLQQSELFPISWAVEMRHLFMNASLNTVQLGLSSVALMHRFVTAASVSHGRVSCHSWADVWGGGGSLRYTAHVNLDFHGLQLSSSICVSMSEADSDRSTTGMIRVPVRISWLNDNAPVSVWMAEVNNMSQSTIFLAGLVRVAADRRYKVDFWCGLI